MRGISLRKLAQQIRISAGHLSRIENDEKLPSAPLLDDLCQALKLSNGALDPWVHQALYSQWRSVSGVFYSRESSEPSHD
jgi:transcriptional regulator with XRE-family HTH domain